MLHATFRRCAALFLAAAAAALLPLLAGTALAALKADDAGIPLEKSWNPHPAQDDIILPMPCGLSLALKAVAVPAAGFMEDKRFYMGVTSAQDERLQMYARRFESHISAPFSQRDIPASWQAVLPADEKEHYLYYFIGKYEISEQQWEAVMSDQCPAGPLPAADRPKRDISWFDMQLFLRKYNSWLIQNAPDALPRFADSNAIGFLRLPSEEEWEYAARGGSKVKSENRDNEDMFPLEGKSLADYAVFSDAGWTQTEPQAIGSRQPNPLGLYDTAGNVKEMVQGFFRFSIADQHADGSLYRRLHGASGGILCKGGGFRSDGNGIVPGSRDEVPLYTAQGEQHLDDLGFRVALSGINVPDAARLNALVKEDSERSQKVREQAPPAEPDAPQAAVREEGQGDVPVKLNPEGNPLAELEKIIQGASSQEMRGNLLQFQSLMKDMYSAQERQRDETLDNALRAILYQSEALRSVAYRYYMQLYSIGKAKEILARAKTEKGKREAKETIQKITEVTQETFALLQTATNFYKSALAKISLSRPEDIERHLVQIRKEFAGKDMLSTHMQQNIGALSKHLAELRKNGIDSLSKKQICMDIIPKIHFDTLPFK